MIAHLRGLLAAKGENFVVIEVGGIGWQAFVPFSTLEKLPPRGSEVQLYTHLYVREDALQLYAFTTPGERDLFRRLLTVSGIGPRLALAALSALPLESLQDAIARGDVRLLSRIPGIGKRTAERLTVELRGKLDLPGALEVAAGSEGISSAGADALEALQELGYSQAEALAALKEVAAQLREAGKEVESAELLRLALRQLNR